MKNALVWWSFVLCSVLATPAFSRTAEAPPPEADEVGRGPVTVTARLRDFRHRTAREFRDIDVYLRELLPHAALAATAYCDDIFERQRISDGAPLEEPQCATRPGLTYLQDNGWQRLFSFPGTPLEGLTGNDRGLRFTVFAKDEGEQVRLAVAFRGTDLSSWTDWHSNLRWFLPGRDQYDVVAELVPAILARAKQEVMARRYQRPVGEWLITSTGHSLGGGLAQLFAYKSSEVRAAVAFDPSPVTGYHSCVSDAEVHCNVPIWRVYERGEVLAWARSATRLVYKLSENITELELAMLRGQGMLGKHSMPALFQHLHDAVVARQAPGAPEDAGRRLLATRPDCTCWSVRRPAELAQRPDIGTRCAQLAQAADTDDAEEATVVEALPQVMAALPATSP